MSTLRLEPWAPHHLPLLTAANAESMTTHLGGPETEEEVLRRHQRYLLLDGSGEGWMRAIVVDDEPAGSIGAWPIQHDAEDAYETGWNVLPAWQGRGVAARAVRDLIRLLRSVPSARPHLIAYPSVDNLASNALCRAVGFREEGERDLPFRGVVLRTRVWVLNLR